SGSRSCRRRCSSWRRTSSTCPTTARAGRSTNRSSAAPTSGSRCSCSSCCGGGGVRHADVVAYCLAKPGAVADTPWEEDLVAKVGGKIFAFLGGNGVGLKCGRDADEAAELRQRFPDTATVMPYIGRYGWNSIALDGAIADDELRELIDASCDAVVARLPKRLRPRP